MGSAPLIPTGIHGLDVQLGGGVPEGSVILMIGESTNALSTFLEQFAAHGLSSGAAVHWYELDRPAPLVPLSVERFVEGSAKSELHVVEALDPSVANLANGFGDAERVQVADVPSEVLRVMTEAGDSEYRMIVTSLTSMLDTISGGEAVAWMRKIIYLARGSRGIVILPILDGAHAPQLVARLKHLATGVMELGLERKGFGLYSYLKVEKLVGIADATKLLLFSETEKGLRLESTRRVL